MKIIEWIKGQRLNVESLEIEETEDGKVILQSWQFALLISKYENIKFSMYGYFALTVILFALWILSIFR